MSERDDVDLGKMHLDRVPSDAKAGDLCLRPGKIRIGKASYPADIGTLIVPEKRSNPSTRSIALPVVRIRSRAPQPVEPIFWLAGGPGESNVKSQVPAWLLADHDVVLVGYRGVDGSSVLECPEIGQAFRGKSGDLLGPASLANIARAAAAGSQRLEAEGVDLEGYTIPEVVQDMEAARVALGYDRIDLLSMSYGTRIAQIYAYLYPASLHRSAMISVNPPGHFVWEPSTIDEQLQYYATLWAQDPRRVQRTASLVDTLRQVRRHMPRRWLFFPIDPGKVRLVAFAMLFRRGSAASVFDAYLAAAQGDPSGLWLMSAASDFMIRKAVTWGDLFAKGGSADYDPSRDYGRELDPPESILGSPLALAVWGAVGKAWPVKLIPSELRQPQPSDTPTLLVSGSVDFSTPAEFATRELLPFLARGRQVILREYGHVGDIFSLNPRAIERLLVSFFGTGDADESLFTYAPTDLTVALGFPRLAKLILGGGIALLLVLATLIVCVVIR